MQNKTTKDRNAAENLLVRLASEIVLDDNEADYVRKDARLVIKSGMSLSKNLNMRLRKWVYTLYKECIYTI